MKRIERWIVTLLVVHGLLLVVAQLGIEHTSISLYVNPVYEYIGVFNEEEGAVIKTIDQFLTNMLSF